MFAEHADTPPCLFFIIHVLFGLMIVKQFLYWLKFRYWQRKIFYVGTFVLEGARIRREQHGTLTHIFVSGVASHQNVHAIDPNVRPIKRCNDQRFI